MKRKGYQKRFYRKRIKAPGLLPARIVIAETDLEILTDRPLDKVFARERTIFYRRQIESYIAKDKRFFSSLKPVAVELTAPPIVKEMAAAARKTNVGPMAGVAGAIAEFLGKDLLNKGYKEVIIENGGDIFMKSSRLRRVGIYSGGSRRWNKLFLKVRPQDTPLGICASSGTIGHSLSFGRTQSAVVLSKSPILSDAAATAAANRVNSKEDFPQALAFLKTIRGLTGAVIIVDNYLFSWGKVEFCTAN